MGWDIFWMEVKNMSKQIMKHQIIMSLICFGLAFFALGYGVGTDQYLYTLLFGGVMLLSMVFYRLAMRTGRLQEW